MPQVCFTIPYNTLDKLTEIASEKKRKLSNQLCLIVEEYIQVNEATNAYAQKKLDSIQNKKQG